MLGFELGGEGGGGWCSVWTEDVVRGYCWRGEGGGSTFFNAGRGLWDTPFAKRGCLATCCGYTCPVVCRCWSCFSVDDFVGDVVVNIHTGDKHGQGAVRRKENEV